MNATDHVASQELPLTPGKMVEFWIGFTLGWLVAACLPVIEGDILGIIAINTTLWIVAIVIGRICKGLIAKLSYAGILAVFCIAFSMPLKIPSAGGILLPSVPLGIIFGSLSRKLRWKLFLGFVAGQLATNGLLVLGIIF